MPRKLVVFTGLVSLLSAATIAAILLTPASREQINTWWRSLLALAPAHAARSAPTVAQPWVAAAPGRVEPHSGLVRLAASISGRVDRIAVKANDHVEKGDVLLQLGDEDARARLAADVAQAGASKRERDTRPITPGRESATKAEDALFDAQRAVASARQQLDDAIAKNRGRADTNQSLAAARTEASDAMDRLHQAKAKVAVTHAKGNVPAPSRLEAQVIADRAKVTLAQAQFDRTRVRGPLAGTVLQINARVGELVVPTGDTPLVTMGDITQMRVRAEVDERDVAKIKAGQSAVVRCDAYPGMDFGGRVVEVAPLLASPTMRSRHVHEPTNVGVMRVLIDLGGSVPLLSGMRTDVFFRPYAEPVGAAAPTT